MKKLLMSLFTVSLFLAMPFALFHVEAAAVTGSTLVSYFDSTNHVDQSLTGNYGSKVTISPTTNSGYTFAFWVVNGIVRDDLPSTNEFILTDDLEIKAVYAPNGQYATAFMDSNGHLLKVDYFNPLQTEPTDAVVPPAVESLPTKPGYDVASSPWGTVNFSSVTEHTVYTLQYTPRDDWSARTYTITVNNGSGDGTYAYNTVVTAVADAVPEGQYFTGWIDDYDNVISYDTTYKFTALSSRTIEATYGDIAPIVLQSIGLEVLSLRAGYVSYLGQFGYGAGIEVVEWGILTSPYSEGDGSFQLEDSWTTTYRSNFVNSTTNEFLVSLPNDDYIAACAYLTYLEDGVVNTIYSGTQTYIGNQQVWIQADYGTVETYATATAAGWLDSGGYTAPYIPLDVAGEYLQSPAFNALTGQLTVSMNVWVTEAGSSNTFKIEAYNASNELLETSGNITLSSAGFTNAYNNFSYKFANASKTISYIKLTYNKEASGVNMRFGSLTVEEGAPIRPDSIAVTGSTHDIATGATIQLTATASPQGSIGTVTWSSSNASIASVNGSGLVTGNAAGSATIYATSTIDSSLVGSYAVTVQNPFTISVSFDDNGTASASPTAVLSGGSSTITMVPNSGYVTSTITINSGAPINLNGATTYTIDAIAQNTTVYITFVSGIEEVVISQNLLGTVTTPPTGWTYYNITSYADTSLKMDADGDYIITKSFILQTSATFTISVKGWTYSSGSLIFYNQRGEIIATLSAFTNTQASYSFTITDITVTSVKVQFDKTTGNLGIWSINISHIIE